MGLCPSIKQIKAARSTSLACIRSQLLGLQQWTVLESEQFKRRVTPEVLMNRELQSFMRGHSDLFSWRYCGITDFPIDLNLRHVMGALRTWVELLFGAVPIATSKTAVEPLISKVQFSRMSFGVLESVLVSLYARYQLDIVYRSDLTNRLLFNLARQFGSVFKTIPLNNLTQEIISVYSQ